MLYWIFLGLCAVALVCGLWRLGLNPAAQAGSARRALLLDVAALIALAPVALFTVSPYLGRDLVGGGDSYFYGLQVADFVTQLRAGILPVFVGQSDYAFNGNINSLRTAPYFTHLAGLLDLVTGRQLSFVSLLNLTVTTTALLAAWAAYLVARAACGGRRLAAWLLAVAYVASPAILGPQICNDMFATYMAAPWLVICWYGLAGILQRENDLRPQLIAAGALAMTWYAHSPIAAWLSMIWALVQALKLVLGGASPDQWRRQFIAALLFAGLGAYVFSSISTLGSRVLGPPDLSAFTFNFGPDYLRDSLQAEFTPFTLSAAKAGIQLGWTMWLLLLGSVCALFWQRKVSGVLLLALLSTLLAYLIPLPAVAETMWRLLPERLLAQTPWPAQRLCPLIGAGIIVATALALRAIGGKSAIIYRSACGLLLLGCIWSLVEVRALHHRPALTRQPPAAYATRFDRENLTLTRYSYGLFDEPPEYFTHGWADPEFESRLLDAGREVAQDNAGATLAAAGAGAMTPIEGQAGIDLSGHAEYLLVFAFTDKSAAGEITLQGGDIERHYLLPRSGEVLAFGSEPGCARTIPVRLPPTGKLHLTIASTVPAISFRAVPVNRDTLPIQVRGLMPYTATVRAAAPGFLETPRVYLDGYAAAVNGAPAAAHQSPNGLVMIPVPAGESQVVISYPGPVSLRVAWLFSLATLAAFPWLLVRAGRTTANQPTRPDDSTAWIREKSILAGIIQVWHHRRPALRTAVAAGLVLGLGWLARQLWLEYHSYGSIRLTVELTRRSRIRPEPLLTLGRKGAADCIYVIYDDLHQVRFGLDHWGSVGLVSDPVPITYGQPHVVEIGIGGLYPTSTWFNRPGPDLAGKPGFAPLVVKLDGRTVLQGESRYYPAGPRNIHVGQNPTGGSVTRGQFSGLIHAVERVVPSAPAR